MSRFSEDEALGQFEKIDVVRAQAARLKDSRISLSHGSGGKATPCEQASSEKSGAANKPSPARVAATAHLERLVIMAIFQMRIVPVLHTCGAAHRCG